MRIIVSPAKKMRADTDSLPCLALPRFLAQTERLLQALQQMDGQSLKTLWRCNDRIAAQNIARLQSMQLRQNLTPAILAFDGIQYQYMAPGVFTDQEYMYVQEHLRILSGFYGLLCPFDGVTAYRLEMQARLAVGQAGDLYAFWSDAIARALVSETRCIVNLASKEYSQCVTRYLPPEVRFITCVFGEAAGEKTVEKGTLCKMARGQMVRYMAENRIEDVQQLKSFDCLHYRFSPERSDEDTYVFLRQTR